MRHLTNQIEPGGAPAPRPSLLPKGLAEAVLRYRWWIICTSLAVTTLVTLWTFRLPKVYQATVTLEYDPNPISPLGTSVEDVSGQVSHFLMSREFFETQNRIIQSRAVAERVVEHLGLADDPTFFGQEPGADWTPVSKEVAAQRLQSKLSLDPIKDTRLVLLKVRDNDPERAATLANMVASSYIEKTMEDRLGSTAAAAEWLAQQLDSTTTQLNESEHALHEFKKQHNVLSVSVENRQNLLAEEIREYNERLTDIRARRIELEARLGRLKAARSQPEAVQDTDRGDDSELDALRTELRLKMTERASLAVRYGDSHPKILELKGEIAAIRASIDYEIKTTPDSQCHVAAESGKYDFILSSQVLEHVPDPQSYLREAYRMLRPGGRMLLSTHGIFEDHGCPYDFRRWTSYGLHAELESAGFDVTQMTKLTTGPRAALFLLQQHRRACKKSSMLGMWMWALKKIMKYRRDSFDRQCDANYGEFRVVTEALADHRIYVGLMTLAVKKDSQVDDHRPDPAMSREPANV